MENTHGTDPKPGDAIEQALRRICTANCGRDTAEEIKSKPCGHCYVDLAITQHAADLAELAALREALEAAQSVNVPTLGYTRKQTAAMLSYRDKVVEAIEAARAARGKVS